MANASTIKVLQLRIEADLLEALEDFQQDPSEATLATLANVKSRRDLLTNMIEEQNKQNEAAQKTAE
jgi:hypothetical protein